MALILALALSRFLQLSGGVATVELLTPGTLNPEPGTIILDVTNRPTFTLGCVYAGSAPAGQVSVPSGPDTCVQPAPVKFIAGVVIAAQLSAAEWTLAQTKIAAGDSATARALAALLSIQTAASSSAAVAVLVTQGVLSPARSSTINTALAVAAQ